MIQLQYYNGTEWIDVSLWANETLAWVSLGGDNYNYRTLDAEGIVLTDKSGTDDDIENPNNEYYSHYRK